MVETPSELTVQSESGGNSSKNGSHWSSISQLPLICFSVA